MTCNIEIFDRDVVDIRFDWTTTDGSIKDVTGATLEALAQKFPGDTVVTLSSSIVNASLGRTNVIVDASALDVGKWTVQLNMTIGSDIQTGEETIQVKRSIPSP